MQDQETIFDIEKMIEAKKNLGQNDIVFDNQGNMYVDDREYRRNTKRIWRSVMEGKKLRAYTTKKRKSKKCRKQERQNRKRGRK